MTTTKVEIKLLQHLQNQLMRILEFGSDLLTPTATLLEKTQMMSVKHLSFVAVAIVAHKAATLVKHFWLASQLHQQQPIRTSGENKAPQRTRTNLRGECFTVKAIKAYNMLPVNMRGLQPAQFKKEVKKWV